MFKTIVLTAAIASAATGAAVTGVQAVTHPDASRAAVTHHAKRTQARATVTMTNAQLARLAAMMERNARRDSAQRRNKTNTGSAAGTGAARPVQTSAGPSGSDSGDSVDLPEDGGPVRSGIGHGRL